MIPVRWSFGCTRLAPSPTGALHLGHARTFLVTWWLARQAGARIIMRMEDLDAARAKPESVQQAYDDLRWLGMDWDAGPGRGGENEVADDSFVQSRRLGVYAAALLKLERAGLIYPCTCTRGQIAAVVLASGGAPHETDAQWRYPGICRDKPREQVVKEAAGTGGACWRLRVRAGVVEFRDQIMGPQAFDVAREAGDFPLTRFGPLAETLGDFDETGGGRGWGPPAYQLACVVDDAAMGIEAVIRGDDLLSSTPRQILLYRALGAVPPRFGHVPLVIGPDGKRLAKRHGESRIAQYREQGVPAERIIGWVAWRSGQLDAPREISATEVLARFDLARLPRQRVVMTGEDLGFLTR